jgi:hypothetical protein
LFTQISISTQKKKKKKKKKKKRARSRNSSPSWQRRIGHLTDFLKRRRVAWPARYVGWAFIAAATVTVVPPLNLGASPPAPEVPVPLSELDGATAADTTSGATVRLLAALVGPSAPVSAPSSSTTASSAPAQLAVLQTNSNNVDAAFVASPASTAALLRILLLTLTLCVLAAGKAALRPHILRLHNRLDAAGAAGAALTSVVAAIGVGCV